MKTIEPIEKIKTDQFLKERIAEFEVLKLESTMDRLAKELGLGLFKLTLKQNEIIDTVNSLVEERKSK